MLSRPTQRRARRSPPTLRTHRKPREPQKNVCARLIHASMREAERLEILPRARLRNSRACSAPMARVRSKGQLPSGRPKDRAHARVAFRMCGSLSGGKGVREQASRGCPSARGCIALDPARRRIPPCPNSRPQLMALAGGACIPPGYAQIGGSQHVQSRAREGY